MSIRDRQEKGREIMTTIEPATTDTTQTAQHERRLRRTLRFYGLVLWILVLAGLFVVWRGRRNLPTEPSAISQTPGGTSPPSGSLTLGSGKASSNPRVVVPKPNSPSHRPIWDPNGIEDFSLTERSGKTITKSDLLGHPWAVCFIFTRCAGPCPRISAQMYELQTSLKNKNVRLVTITVDPKYDSPKVLRRYAKMFGADPNRWLYLTGDQRGIYRLIHRSFKLPVKEIVGEDRQPGFQVIHTTYILHVDAFGRVRGKYNAQLTPDMVSLRRVLDRDRSAAEYRAWRHPVAAPKPPLGVTPPSGGSGQEDR